MADLYLKIRPLAAMKDVDVKVTAVRDKFESSLEGVSRKCDCARDKRESMEFTEQVKNLVRNINKVNERIHNQVEKNTKDIELKADQDVISNISKRLDKMPTNSTVK